MKNNNHLTVFESIQKKKKRIHRIVAGVLLPVLVVTTCFSSNLLRDVAEAETRTKDPEEYINYVIGEMKADPDRKFTILEIVPDDSQGEFDFYAAQPEIVEKLSYLTQDELKKIDGWWQGREDKNVYHKVNNLYALKDMANINDFYSATTALLNFRTIEDGITGEISIELENAFLQVVVPEYYSMMRDRMEVKIMDANDVTVIDVRNADLIYIHGYSQQGNVQPVNELLTTLVDENTRGPIIQNANYNKDGTAKSADAYSFEDFEYVEKGSEEDIKYEDNMTAYANADESLTVPYIYDSVTGKVNRSVYTAEDKKKQKLAEYTKEVEDDKGYYKSRDISWAVVEEIWELNLYGKYFPMDNAYATVPIMVDNNSMIGQMSTNASKMIGFCQSVSAEKIKPSETSIVTVCGYDIYKQCVSTTEELYNPYGLRTGILDMRYLGLAEEEKLANGTCSDSVTGHVATAKQRWDQYIGNFVKYQPDRTAFLQKIRDTYGIGDSWSLESERVVFPLLNNPTYDGVSQKILRENFLAYNHDSVLVPSSRNEKLPNATGEWTGYNGLEERIPNSDDHYMYNLIRWILGASGNPSVDPNPGTGSTVELNFLEIEPCNDFKYADNDKGHANVEALLKKITNREYKYDSASGLYITADSKASSKDTKYHVLVDSYTVNAFNGLLTDIIAEYDMVYLGTEHSAMNSYYSNYKEMFQNDSVYSYFAETTIGTNTIQANDLTDVRRQELADFVNAGKILLVSQNTVVSQGDGSVNYKKTTVGKDSQVAKLLAEDLKDNTCVVYENNAEELFYKLDKTSTPAIQITQVKDAGGNDMKDIGTDSSVYTTQDGIGGIIDATAITTTGGFTISYEITNCKQGKKYRTVFYIDEDNDGIYGEDVSECKYISEEVKAEMNPSDPSGMTAFVGSLNVSSVVLPDNFNSGLVSWRICVYETAEETDAYAEKLEIHGSAEEIYVNRIKRDTAQGKVGMKNIAAVSIVELNVLELTADGTGLSVDAELERYLKPAENAIGYDVVIDTIKATDFTNDKLIGKEYHILVLSTKIYEALGDDQKNIIKNWADKDKSILFLNDTATTLSDDVLPIVGQQKKESAGVAKKSSIAETLNEGQITQYPYDIDKSAISVTEAQSIKFQTMLGFTDAAVQTTYGIAVWNTFTNGNTDVTNYFDAGYKDAVNNAYLYSKGNIMYTAMGKCQTDAEYKLMVNMLIRAGSKMQWVDSPAIVVNNGILAVDGYYIYVDLDEIKETADAATKEQLQRENYIIDFTATNYDNGDMDGEIFWYKDAATPITLRTYVGAEQLHSGVMYEINLTELQAVLGADYGELMTQIENGVADIRIKAINSELRETEKKVVFKQRKIYNLK